MQQRLAQDEPHWPLHGKRILVVEDHAHTAALVRQALLAAGAIEVVVAGDGAQALAQLGQLRPDVLVTDMIMPVTGGLELIKVVRQAALVPNPEVPDPTIPIVLVSAFGSRQAVRLAQAAGIDTFVIKPFSLGSLVRRVDRAAHRVVDFIVEQAYVGPDRRTVAGRGVRRRTDAPDDGAAPSASQLKALYARIREMEDERVAEGAG